MRGPLLVLLLLAPGALGAPFHADPPGEPDDDVLLRPLRVLSEAAREVVRDATSRELEAAESRGIATTAYARRLAEAPPLSRAVEFGDEVLVAHSVRSIPPGVRLLGEARRDCERFGGNATDADFRRWTANVSEGSAILSAADGILAGGSVDRDTAAAATLAGARENLTAWTSDTSWNVHLCLEALRLRLGLVDGGGNLTLAVVPRSTWPTDTVVAAGSVTDPGGDPVRIRSATLGLAALVAVSPEGRFIARFTVPRNASLGEHAFVATRGNATASAFLLVVRAPTSLEVDVASAPVGANATVTFRLRAPAALADAVVGASLLVRLADRDERVALADGAGALRVPSTPDGLAGVAEFEGNDVLDSARRTFRIPPAAAAPLPPASASSPETTLRLPLSVAAIAVAAALAGVVGALVYLRLRDRAPPVPPEILAAPVEPPPPATGRTGLAGFFADVRDDLVRRGLVAEGATAREIGRAVGTHHPETDEAVRAFEAVRYGGRPEPPGLLGRLRAWWSAVLRRLTEAFA